MIISPLSPSSHHTHQPSTQPITPSSAPPNRSSTPTPAPSLSFLEREKRGLVKKRIKREWAQVEEKEKESRSGATARSIRTSSVIQPSLGKLSMTGLPQLENPARGFEQGTSTRDNFGSKAFIYIYKTLRLAIKLMYLHHQPFGM